MAELEESLGHDEWVRWVAFHALFDLPDGFFVAVKAVAGLTGESPEKVAPYYAPPPGKPGGSNLRAAFAAMRSLGHARIPKRQPR